MIKVGTRVIGNNGREGVVVFNPFNQDEGMVSIDYGRGLSLMVEPEKGVKILGRIEVKVDERCKDCIFNNVYGDPCARYTPRRFIALHGDHQCNQREVPIEPYPECKGDIRRALQQKKAV